jgi:hypothetical protein
MSDHFAIEEGRVSLHLASGKGDDDTTAIAFTWKTVTFFTNIGMHKLFSTAAATVSWYALLARPPQAEACGYGVMVRALGAAAAG